MPLFGVCNGALSHPSTKLPIYSSDVGIKLSIISIAKEKEEKNSVKDIYPVILYQCAFTLQGNTS